MVEKSRTIHKFKLILNGVQEIIMPMGSSILCVQTQYGDPYVWAELPPQRSIAERRTIRIFGTGEAMRTNENLKYIGTIQQSDGNLVWHVYEGI